MSKKYTTQNELLLKTLLRYYQENECLDTILPIINGEANISIRIIDWFVTNYAKKNYTVYTIVNKQNKIGLKIGKKQVLFLMMIKIRMVLSII